MPVNFATGFTNYKLFPSLSIYFDNPLKILDFIFKNHKFLYNRQDKSLIYQGFLYFKNFLLCYMLWHGYF